jgi:hypothetical protein
VNPAYHYALVVGIDRYPNLDGGRYNLRCPQEDASAFGKWFQETQTDSASVKEKSQRFRVITRQIPADRRPPAPVVYEIISALEDLIQAFQDRLRPFRDTPKYEASWRASRLYLYVSGHGLDFTADDSVLLTADARDGIIPVSTFSVANALSRLTTSFSFAEVLVFADCCRQWRKGTPLYFFEQVEDPPLRPHPPKTFVASAAKFSLRAYEPKAEHNLSNSIFTMALLDGLRGQAADPRTGIISTNRLKGYLYEQVPSLSLKFNGEKQEPDIKGANFEIAQVAPLKSPASGSLPLRIITISIAAASAFEADRKLQLFANIGHLQPPEQLPLNHDASTGEYTVGLTDGLYLIVLEGDSPKSPQGPHEVFQVEGEDKAVAL